MRPKRIKITAQIAIYHLISRTVAGEHLLEPKDQEVLRKQLHKMAAFCGIEVLTYCILSNHFHLLVRVPPKREIPDTELVRRYASLYGSHDARVLEENLANSPRACEIREGLWKRMHDISFFMKELKMRFTIYYNETYDRFGTFWAERFKSLLVESKSSRNAVLAVAAYIDLNPVRAGLCGDPKDYRFCGYAEAVAGNADARRGLAWVLERPDWREASRSYRTVLFGSGVVSDRSCEGGIDEDRSRKVMAERGELPLSERLRCRIRYFSDGLAFGSSGFVKRMRGAFGESPTRKWTPPEFPTSKNQKLFFARRQKNSL